jgi:hypothetical protein
VIVKNDCIVNHNNDEGGYLHFGRIINSGSTGGTGSVYGGIIFQNEVNQLLIPPSGARYWISRIDGNIVDSRQKTMSVGFVATNYPEGNLSGMPSEVDANGTVTVTSTKNPKAYQANEIATKTNPNFEMDLETGNPEEQIAL